MPFRRRYGPSFHCERFCPPVESIEILITIIFLEILINYFKQKDKYSETSL